MSDTLGKFREYETVVVLPADLPDEAGQEVFGRLTEIVEKAGGSVLRQDGWGKKKFAYDVRNNSRGNYLVFHYAAPSDTVFAVERHLRNSDVVVRFVTHRFGEVTDLEARRADVEKMMREQARRQEEAEAAQEAPADEADASAEAS